jgi:hypothetical protein
MPFQGLEQNRQTFPLFFQKLDKTTCADSLRYENPEAFSRGSVIILRKESFRAQALCPFRAFRLAGHGLAQPEVRAASDREKNAALFVGLQNIDGLAGALAGEKKRPVEQQV